MAVPRYQLCTIWSTAGTPDPITGLGGTRTARVYKCSARIGGNKKMVSTEGQEFYPTSTFWVRSGDLVEGSHSTPEYDELIALGDQSMFDAPVGAKEIKSLTVHNHDKWGQGESYTIGVA